MPEPLAGKHIPNELDRLLRKMRTKNLKEIVEKCEKLPNMEFKAVLQELETFYKILDQLEEDVNLIFFYKDITNSIFVLILILTSLKIVYLM